MKKGRRNKNVPQWILGLVRETRTFSSQTSSSKQMAQNRGLNPTLAPLPEACVNNILNISCAQQMAGLCATNTPNGPALLDGASNCRLWKDTVETAYAFDPENSAPSQKALDECILNYCRNAGVNSNACSCLNFPFVMRDQCNAQGSRGCSTESAPGQANECLGKVFTQVGGGQAVENKGGTITTPPYIVIEFPDCIPFYCWNDYCWQPDSLLVSSVRSSQASCVPGICINVQGVDQITISDLQPPASPQSFRPRQLLINSCGRGHTAATPIFIPTAYTFPVNVTTAVPFALTNLGDDILNMQLKSISNNPYKCTAPDITIGPHGSFNFNVTFDNDLLQALWAPQSSLETNSGNVQMIPFEDDATVTKGFLRSPEFFYTYPAGNSLLTFSFGLTLTLTPPVPEQTAQEPFVVNKDIPLVLNIALIVAGIFFILAVITLVVAQRNARTVATEIFKTPF